MAPQTNIVVGQVSGAAEAAAKLGIAGELLDAAGMDRRGLPRAFTRGYFEPHGGILHPGRYVRGLGEAARRAGARIFEYGPSMVHAKIALFDGKWALAGSTNLDSRSFGINDEVNVAIPDPAVVARLEEDFQHDLARAREMTYEQWIRRPFWEKLQEWCGWLIQKQE